MDGPPPAKPNPSLASSLRTHTCGELRISNVGQTVSLCGWIQKIRDVGLTFIDLRDRFGVTQIAIDPNILPQLEQQVSSQMIFC